MKTINGSSSAAQVEAADSPRPRRGLAVVTGSSGGVGRATAIEFARRGYDVALLARGHAGLEAAASEVSRCGRRSLALSVDVSEYEAVEAAARRTEDELGEIDVWVNNAMTTVFQRVVDTDPDDFARAIEVTFLGQVWGTMVALEHMRSRDRGSIVNVGSALAFLGIPLQAPYCASKFACRGFFESVRSELIEEGSAVSISMVHLPALNTPQFDWCQTDVDRKPQPVPPIYQPEVAARHIAGAALDPRRAVVVGVWNRLIVAVASVAPGFANQFAAVSGRTSQLTDEPIDENRPSNLREPADERSDHGSHGRFDDRAGGVLDPSFLSNLPTTVSQFVAAARARLAERVNRLRASHPHALTLLVADLTVDRGHSGSGAG